MLEKPTGDPETSYDDLLQLDAESESCFREIVDAIVNELKQCPSVIVDKEMFSTLLLLTEEKGLPPLQASLQLIATRLSKPIGAIPQDGGNLLIFIQRQTTPEPHTVH